MRPAAAWRVPGPGRDTAYPVPMTRCLPGADDTASHPLAGVAGGQGGGIRRWGTVGLLVAIGRNVGEVIGTGVNDHRRARVCHQLFAGERTGGGDQHRRTVRPHLQRGQVAGMAWMVRGSAALEVPTGRKEVARGTPLGATELTSHLPTVWICNPCAPGVSLPGSVVWTMTVATPSRNSIVAAAT